MNEIWDLWFPAAGATGLPFARVEIDQASASRGVLVHSAPPVLDVTVRDESGRTICEGKTLRRKESWPMARLIRRDADLSLEDTWPGPDDEGCLVILPGGEAGVLTSWWHADDRSEWRWQVEFSNHV